MEIEPQLSLTQQEYDDFVRLLLNPFSARMALQTIMEKNKRPFFLALDYITSEDYQTKIILPEILRHPDKEVQRFSAAVLTLRVVENAPAHIAQWGITQLLMMLARKLQDKYPNDWQAIQSQSILFLEKAKDLQAWDL